MCRGLETFQLYFEDKFSWKYTKNEGRKESRKMKMRTTDEGDTERKNKLLVLLIKAY